MVAAFGEGATAEEIVQQYPSLDLGDVYAVLAYYLRHRLEVDAHLEARRRRGGVVGAENEARLRPAGAARPAARPPGRRAAGTA